jgi:hypothetical protein
VVKEGRERVSVIIPASPLKDEPLDKEKTKEAVKGEKDEEKEA